MVRGVMSRYALKRPGTTFKPTVPAHRCAQRGALSLHLVAFLDVLDGQIAISTRSVANDLAITEHFVVDHVEWERSLLASLLGELGTVMTTLEDPLDQRVHVSRISASPGHDLCWLPCFLTV